jgi:hypothetical protein
MNLALIGMYLAMVMAGGLILVIGLGAAVIGIERAIDKAFDSCFKDLDNL